MTVMGIRVLVGKRMMDSIGGREPTEKAAAEASEKVQHAFEVLGDNIPDNLPLDHRHAAHRPRHEHQIGRASCRERV